MRYRLRISYDGAPLSGWQCQNNAPSVQEEVSKALSVLFSSEIQVTGAGRTDAGVNAVNYIAHFDAPSDKPFDTGRIEYKLNAILPKNIVVHELSPVADDFHARFSAISRRYHYFIHFHKDPFADRFSWRSIHPLDLERMNLGAQFLIGTHDFSCFEKVGGNNKTSICTVRTARWSIYRPTHVSVMGYPCNEGDYIVFEIEADRFLRNMVRAVVGSLVEVGRGKKDPQWIRELIEKGTRSDAGTSVPGNALFLSEVLF